MMVYNLSRSHQRQESAPMQYLSRSHPRNESVPIAVFIKWYNDQQERSLFLRIEKDGDGGILQVIWGKDLEKSWIIPKENLSYLSAMKYSNLSD